VSSQDEVMDSALIVLNLENCSWAYGNISLQAPRIPSSSQPMLQDIFEQHKMQQNFEPIIGIFQDSKRQYYKIGKGIYFAVSLPRFKFWLLLIVRHLKNISESLCFTFLISKMSDNNNHFSNLEFYHILSFRYLIQ
jgi:hypothetical protein